MRSVEFLPLSLNDLAQMTGLSVDALLGLIASLAGAALLWLLVMVFSSGRRRA